MHDLTSSGPNTSANYHIIGAPSSSSSAATMSCKREALKLDGILTGGLCAPPPDKRPRMTDLALPDLPSCATVGGNADAAEKDGALLTPTPTQFLFPKQGTEEQEDYVRGFSQALAAIYQRNGVGSGEPPIDESAVPLMRVVGPEGSTWTTVSTSSYTSDSYADNHVLFPSTIACGSVPFTSTSSCLISLSNPMMTSSQGINMTSPLSLDSDRYSFVSPTYMTSQLTSENSILPASTVFTTLQNYQQPRPTSLPPSASSNYPSVRQNVNSVALRDSYSHSDVTRPVLPTIPVNQTSCGQVYRMDDSSEFYSSTRYNSPNLTSTMMLKSEPDSEGEMRSSFQSTGGVSMNPDDQERMKLERKRAKNRVAAQRCQQRKIEKITRLEDKVAALRDQNANLSQTVAALSEHISGLKQQIVAHADRGCRLMLPHIPT